ncbi:MAG: hypothetical protein KatS3mg102_1643 [Planctomycetota bacterium]|nr:MAG: hypothetical protein KatS3mg102_1643 [Planctomycetota bacterium]
MTKPADIFEAMPGRFDPAGAGNWETTIQFKLRGEDGGDWVMRVKDGSCTVEQGTAEQPKATIEMDAATWVGIHTGTVNPMQAFMTGKIKVTGNMGEVMKLNNPAIFRR